MNYEKLIAKGLITEEGAQKLRNNREKNESKYGKDIYKEYDEAFESGDKVKLSESFYTVDGLKFVNRRKI